MQPKALKHLEDVRDAAGFIRHATGGKSLDDYRNDRMLRQAVERNFEIIGEAMRRLSRDDPHTAARISSHQQIVAFRNLLIHGYDLIDDEKVWHVIQHDLSKLEQEVTDLLSEAASG